MSKTFKSVLFGLVGLIVVGVLGYGVYSYVNKTGFFTPAETPMVEATEEFAIGE